MAVDYYLNHGRSISRTIRAVGYPSRPTLREWIDELDPGELKIRIEFIELDPKAEGIAVEYLDKESYKTVATALEE